MLRGRLTTVPALHHFTTNQNMESKLKNARENRKLTQKGLSELTGVSIRTLQAMEQGARMTKSASLTVLLKLCLALRCRLEDIVDDTETLELLRRYEER